MNLKNGQKSNEKLMGRMVESPCILFAGGGTGGHLMPALATAQAIKERNSYADCIFLTSKRVLDPFGSALQEFCSVTAPEVRWQGINSATTFTFVSAGSIERTLETFRRYRPDAVVGMGGWGCAAAVFAAKMFNIPTMLFEANAVPGRTVKFLSRLADKVQLQWEIGRDKLGTAEVLPCGTPVRADVLEGDRRRAAGKYGLDPSRTTMLVLGGTQGALPLNNLLPETLKLAAVNNTRLQVLHITGADHAEKFKNYSVPRGIVYRSLGFEPQMHHAYSIADFALCRAGGGTLAELTALGIPSILVPYPHAADGHQLANASRLAEAGAADLIEQHNASPARLADAVASLAGCKERRMKMKTRAEAIGRPDAAWKVAGEVMKLAGKKRGTLQKKTHKLEGMFEEKTISSKNINLNTFNRGAKDGRSKITYGTV